MVLGKQLWYYGQNYGTIPGTMGLRFTKKKTMRIFTFLQIMIRSSDFTVILNARTLLLFTKDSDYGRNGSTPNSNFDF